MLKITISQIFAYYPLVTMMGFKNKFLLTYPLLTTCMTLTWHIGVGCIPMCYISKEAVKIWGFCTILVEKRKGYRHTSKWTNDFLVGRREGTYGKKMTFWKDKWTLRRLDGRYDSFITMSIWLWCRLLFSESVRVSLWERINAIEFFWEVPLSGNKGFQKLKCLSLKIFYSTMLYSGLLHYL